MSTDIHDLSGADQARPVGHDWQEAGRAWGLSAADWVCLLEHYAVEVIAAMHRRTGVGPDTTLLDVACGAGLAIRVAEGAGAVTAGLDASRALVDVALERNPASDIRVGSMFELPWADEAFDVVTSVNGIWGGCQGALEEAHRVLRPGGRIAISFWGRGRPHDLRDVYEVVARHLPATHASSLRDQNDIARPGVAEEMLAAAGFVDPERGSRQSVVEWRDAETAWRALMSVGPAVPALEHGDVTAMKAEVMAVVERWRDRFGIYRYRNDHQFVVARKPT